MPGKEAFIQSRLFDALENNKDVWRELRSLGLLSKAKDHFHGFTPNKLNAHFAGVSVCHSERQVDLDDVLPTARDDGFAFREVTFTDVVLVVAHFSSQARGEDGIPQSVIAKSLPIIRQHLATFFNSALSSGVFPELGRELFWFLLRKRQFHLQIRTFILSPF